MNDALDVVLLLIMKNANLDAVDNVCTHTLIPLYMPSYCDNQVHSFFVREDDTEEGEEEGIEREKDEGGK